MTEPLPTRFPIFPLPSVVLFPGTYLPLHIFEPRYRAMTEAALAGDQIVGMVLICPGENPMQARAPIFSVGCAGRIVESQRLPDGRWNFLLRGERRFQITAELELGEPYRSVEAELADEPTFDELAPATQRALVDARSSLEARALELLRLSAPEGEARVREGMRTLDPLLLVNAISFGFDGPVLEKQSLLEAPDALARSELLLRVLAIQIAEARLPTRSGSLN